MDDFDSLDIFLHVADELSVTGAAKRLGRSPSYVTTKLQKLEANVGVDLIIRQGKRISLAPAGTLFRDYAERLLALRAEAVHVVSGGRAPGAIRVGSMEATAASRLPDVLAGFHRRCPTVDLTLKTGPSMRLLDDVRAGRLDCAFLAIAPTDIDGETGACLDVLDLACREVWEETLVLLHPPEFSSRPASPEAPVPIRTLAAFPPGCTYRRMAETYLGMPARQDWQVRESSSYHVMVALASSGRCVTVLPESVCHTLSLPTSLARTSLGPVKTQLVWRRGYETPAFGDFLGNLDEIPRGP